VPMSVYLIVAPPAVTAVGRSDGRAQVGQRSACRWRGCGASPDVEPRFAGCPMAYPAQETGLARCVAELGAERLGTLTGDHPDVTTVWAGHHKVPVHAVAVGTQHDAAVVEDRT
jgi:hypothetical protein